MKNLVIVESPAKAKTIEKFLGSEYTVLASFGHVRDLPQSELGIDIEGNFEPRYVVPPDKRKTISILKKEIKEEKPDKVYIATDEDREGEAIGWHLLQILGLKDDQYERIVFHEITRPTIREALEHPRKMDMHLIDAQQARRVLDRLVGYKLSPLLWKKIARGLSAGRVQSVAVRLVVEREREIRSFTPQEYWTINAQLELKGSTFPAALVRIGDTTLKIPSKDGKNEGKYIPHKEDADKIIADIGSQTPFLVSQVEVKQGIKNPPPPFTTSTLQQEASRKLGFSVKQTMVLAQKLYEGVEIGAGRTGLITYMRTDSVNVSEQALRQAKEVITKLFGAEFALSEPRRYKTKSKGAQEAHEAIRPVNLALTPEDIKPYLERNELRLYDLIWKRTLACQMKEAQIENTIITLVPEGKEQYQFMTKGETILFPGFIQVYTEGKDEEENGGEHVLPNVVEGDQCLLQQLLSEQHFTKPESRYTEASLVKKLESEGIGRPSTYAPTISTILERKYIEKKEKYLYPTEIGEVVTDFLIEHFPQIVDYKFTAKMEEDLDIIAEGKKEWHSMIKDFFVPFEKNLGKKEKEIEKYQKKTDQMCDLCGKPMVIKMGKFGKFLSCSNFPTCKNIKPLPQDGHDLPVADGVCEKCGAPLVLKTGRFGPFFACQNYPTCTYTKTIIKTIGIKCLECKEGEIIERKTKKFRTFYGCSRYPDCKFTSWSKPVKMCDCGGVMVEAPKKMLKCLTCGKQEPQAT